MVVGHGGYGISLELGWVFRWSMEVGHGADVPLFLGPRLVICYGQMAARVRKGLLIRAGVQKTCTVLILLSHTLFSGWHSTLHP